MLHKLFGERITAIAPVVRHLMRLQCEDRRIRMQETHTTLATLIHECTRGIAIDCRVAVTVDHLKLHLHMTCDPRVLAKAFAYLVQCRRYVTVDLHITHTAR